MTEQSGHGTSKESWSKWVWDLQVMLPDAETRFTICTAHTPEALAELVRVLIVAWGDDQRDIFVKARGK